MTYLFFDENDALLYCREDALSAVWLCHQLALRAEFPRDEDKPIRRGMKLGFQMDGVWQVFEIRRVRNQEPAHVLKVQAEHMAIAELTDCHVGEVSLRDVTASSALADALSGTGWQVGCTFNHIDSMNHPEKLGNGTAVRIINGQHGFIFTGCQLWYGNVRIENSWGIQFSDCLFGNDEIEIQVTGSYPAFFFNNIFWTQPTLDVTTSCVFEGNYLRTGGVVTS